MANEPNLKKALRQRLVGSVAVDDGMRPVPTAELTHIRFPDPVPKGPRSDRDATAAFGAFTENVLQLARGSGEESLSETAFHEFAERFTGASLHTEAITNRSLFSSKFEEALDMVAEPSTNYGTVFRAALPESYFTALNLLMAISKPGQTAPTIEELQAFVREHESEINRLRGPLHSRSRKIAKKPKK
ncbi:MAG: hypothetical protein CVV45_00685 [Spirochaetae bacterium HGW-Spirochaetae-10]|nr:MAG: hypothetical protein CVV45_00685 [Spirochaetae bacterium HGW-Spirochaetae-10]